VTPDRVSTTVAENISKSAVALHRHIAKGAVVALW
jgi:hypothetical protein